MDPAKTNVINLQTETKKTSNLDPAKPHVINLQTETKKTSNMDPAKTKFVSLLHMFWRGPCYLSF
jgi:hypothetical protein